MFNHQYILVINMPSVLSGFSGTAGAKFGFTIKGGQSAIKKLENYANTKRTKLLVAIKKSLILIEAEAIRLVAGGIYWKNPIDTRRMIGSVTNQLVSFSYTGIEGKVGTNVEYAIYVHEGTKMMKKGAENRGKSSGRAGERPFLLDALNNKKDEVITMIIEAYKQDIYR